MTDRVLQAVLPDQGLRGAFGLNGQRDDRDAEAGQAVNGELRVPVSPPYPEDLLRTIGNLTLPAREDRNGHTQRMIGLLFDGLPYGAHTGNPC